MRKRRVFGEREAVVAEEHLEARDVRVLLRWILVGLIGAGIAWRYFFVAFPEAALDFHISRSAALTQAHNFLVAQGHDLKGYQSTIVFDVDDTAKTYLERELGLKEANRLMASEVNVWHWRARFFRPGQKEEFGVEVSPAGHVVGMDQVIEEARAGARLDESAGRAVAERFLRERAGVDLAAYDFLPQEANSTERPNRRDWSFTWERRGFKAKDALARIRVAVQGDPVGGYEQFLKVPEAWQRDFQRLRSSNLLYQSAAQVPFAFLYGAVVLVLFDLGRRGLLRWSGALELGIVLAVLFFLKAANEWPLTRAGYNTNSSYAGFFVSQMGLAVLAAIAAGLSVALTVAAAEPIYRHDFPGKLRLGAIFSVPGIRSKSFFRSCVIGLAMAGAHIGFITVFYVVGRRFGIWTPQDVKYTDTVSTAVPWISPLAIALYAATNEEFLFRLFAIPYLVRLTRSKWVAVIIPAFIWGFLHSAYQVEPGYARGLEVGLIGIVAGWVFLRWGILTTLVWHYTVDALLIGLFLLRSESLYFRLSGAIVAAFVLIPLGVAGVALAARRRFTPEEPLLNGARPLVVAAAEPVARSQAPTEYVAAPSSTLRIALAVGALGALLAIAVEPQAIGDFVRLRVNARQAARDADVVLGQHGVDPSSYRRVVTFIGTYNALANEYLRRQVGIAGANRIYEKEVPSAFWDVRYFRNSQKEEYHVILGPDGTLHAIHHLLPEDAPGVNLSKEAAEAKAEAFLRNEKKVDLTDWKLVEADSTKRPARTDHAFVWEKRGGIGEAHVRKEVRVLGDQVGGYRVFIHIPDEWQRRQTEQTLGRSLYGIGRIVFFVAWGVAILVFFFRSLRQPGTDVPWRRMAGWAVWGAAAMVVLFWNNYRVLLANYDTQWPLRTFVAILLMGLFLVMVVLYSLLHFLYGLAWFYLSRAFGESRVPGWLGMPAAYYRDAFWLGLSGAGLLLGLVRLPDLANRVWPTAGRGLGAALPGGAVASLFPALNSVSSAVLLALFSVAGLGLAVGFLAAYVPRRWAQAAFLLLLAIVLVGSWGSPADFAKRVVLELLSLSVFWLAVTRIFRFNLLAYFLAIAAAPLVSDAVGFLRQPNGFYQVNGCAVAAVLIALLAWPLVVRWSSTGLVASGPSSLDAAATDASGQGTDPAARE